MYLEDEAEIERCAAVLQGWLGVREAYAGFEWGDDVSWHADDSSPVGINPVGTTRDGHPIDGVVPDDQRRGGSFEWPPPKENYVYEALQGVLLQAIILERQGFDVWNWGDQALLRAFRWLHEEADFPAEGDDTWQPWVINHSYDSDFPVVEPSRCGKNFGWTCWLFGGAAD